MLVRLLGSQKLGRCVLRERLLNASSLDRGSRRANGGDDISSVLMAASAAYLISASVEARINKLGWRTYSRDVISASPLPSPLPKSTACTDGSAAHRVDGAVPSRDARSQRLSSTWWGFAWRSKHIEECCDCRDIY